MDDNIPADLESFKEMAASAHCSVLRGNFGVGLGSEWFVQDDETRRLIFHSPDAKAVRVFLLEQNHDEPGLQPALSGDE
jgi:hypothetical protein